MKSTIRSSRTCLLQAMPKGKVHAIQKKSGIEIGAVGSIITIIGKQYVALFIVALIIGAPVSFILVRPLVAGYPYHMPINGSGVAIAAGILIGVLATTVFTQVRKVMQSDPVSGLKVE
jgi:putative ABC transport system permease protein